MIVDQKSGVQHLTAEMHMDAVNPEVRVTAALQNGEELLFVDTKFGRCAGAGSAADGVCRIDPDADGDFFVHLSGNLLDPSDLPRAVRNDGGALPGAQQIFPGFSRGGVEDPVPVRHFMVADGFVTAGSRQHLPQAGGVGAETMGKHGFQYFRMRIGFHRIEEFHFRMVLADGRGRVFAGGPALVVCRRGEFVLHAGVDQDHLVPHGIEREILVFQRLAAQNNLYVLNVGEERNGYPEGSIFESNYRAVLPFQAYVEHKGSNPAPPFFVVGDLGGDTTGIDATLVNSERVNSEAWYTLDGRKLQGKPTQKGVYITNGKKVIIK